jgi:dUTP pyrophosphatase
MSHTISIVQTEGETSINDLYRGIQPSRDDSGYDIFFNRDETIPAGAVSYKIKFGATFAVWNEYGERVPWMLVPRSSIGKTPVRMANSIGIIDKGYNGQLMAIVDNVSDKPVEIKRGDRLFQMVNFNGRPFTYMAFEDELEETDRGAGGFGSTGTSTIQLSVEYEEAIDDLIRDTDGVSMDVRCSDADCWGENEDHFDDSLNDDLD